MIAKMIAKLIPRKVFFASGVGTHPEYLDHLKLHRDAGVEKFNLVTVGALSCLQNVRLCPERKF